MKNYIVVSQICDDIISRVYDLKVLATDPNNPDWMRVGFQRDLVAIKRMLDFHSYVQKP